MSEWRWRAACRMQDPELFFPTATYAPQQVAQAKTVCAACPVQGACLTEALTNRALTGIWGGTTEAERWPAEHACGTSTGASQHKRRGEPPCAACHTFDLARRASERAKRYARRERMEEVAS